MGAGMAVTADNGHARVCESEFWADDVHDALFGGVHVEQGDAEIAAVLLKSLDLLGGNGIGDRSSAGLGRDVVVDGGDGAKGLAKSTAGCAKAIERLWRSDLVNKVQVDVQDGKPTVRLANQMSSPDLFKQSSWHKRGRSKRAVVKVSLV